MNNQSPNFTPYEIGILLDVYCGCRISVNPCAPLYDPTMREFCRIGLVRRTSAGLRDFESTEKLVELMTHVLNAPRPMADRDRDPLSPRQEVLMMFLKTRIAAGDPPTRREIAEHFGFKSHNAAEELLRGVERKGYIKIGAGRHRGIQIIP